MVSCLVGRFVLRCVGYWGLIFGWLVCWLFGGLLFGFVGCVVEIHVVWVCRLCC